jgi:putative hydrolase of the HAD superfamily
MDTMKRSIVLETHAHSRVAVDPIQTGVVPSIQPIPDILAVLFDIYGTLLISGSGDVGTALEQPRSLPFRNALLLAGIAEPDNNAVRQAELLYFEKIHDSHERSRANGVDFPEVDILNIWREVMKTLSTRSILPAIMNEEIIIRIAATYETEVNPIYIMPAAKTTIAQLSADGLHLGIVSNAQFYTDILLEYELGMTLESAGFNPGLCSYSYIAGAAKPSSAIFEPVLEYLSNTCGIPPSRILYVGNDMLNDIYTAGNAGCRTCLFAGDRRSLKLRKNHDLTTNLQADAVITDLSQLLEIVKLSPIQE